MKHGLNTDGRAVGAFIRVSSVSIRGHFFEARLMIRIIASAILLLAVASTSHAGLYYSGEKFSSLPAQWRGFLMDHRLLRNIGLKPKIESEENPLRARYRQEMEALKKRGLKDTL